MNASERILHSIECKEKKLIEIETQDGFNLKLFHFSNFTDKPNVLLIHGVTSSAELFTLHETHNITRYLLENSFDVWVAEWRGSCNLPYNMHGPQYTLDDVALFDIPILLEEIRQTNDKPIHLITHCLGAMATLMAITSGTIDSIASIACNSVGLYPQINELSYLKLLFIPDLLENIAELDYIPLDKDDAGSGSLTSIMHDLADSSRSECENHFCKMLSFTFGSKDPTLFLHQNLLPETHERLNELFGPTPVTIYKHLLKIVSNKAVCKYNPKDSRYEKLPDNYLLESHRINMPLLLISGDKNHTWYQSMRQYYDILQTECPQVDCRYLEIEGYGHQDMFLGKDAWADVFPHFLHFIQKSSL